MLQLMLPDEFEDLLLSFSHTVHLNSSGGKGKRCVSGGTKGRVLRNLLQAWNAVKARSRLPGGPRRREEGCTVAKKTRTHGVDRDRPPSRVTRTAGPISGSGPQWRQDQGWCVTGPSEGAATAARWEGGRSFGSGLVMISRTT